MLQSCLRHLGATFVVLQLGWALVNARVSTTPGTLIETGTHYCGTISKSSFAASAEECSEQCRNESNTCNVFSFCGRMEGCVAGAAGPYPFGTCIHKIQNQVWPPVGGQPWPINIDRDDARIPWTSGAPIFYGPPLELAGWEVIAGVDLHGHFDFACPFAQGPGKSPNIPQCEWEGTAEEIAEVCERVEECRGFVYKTNVSTLPIDSPYSAAIRWSSAVLKGGQDFSAEVAYGAGNPNAVFYYLPGLHEPSIKSNAGSIAGIVIAASIAGTAAAACIWWLLGACGKRTAILGSKTHLRSRPSPTVQVLLDDVSSKSWELRSRSTASCTAGSRADQTADVNSQRRNSEEPLMMHMARDSNSQALNTADEDMSQHDSKEDTSSLGWQIAPEQITICIRPDGKEWQAGYGSFGQVFRALQDGVTVVAIKRLHNELDARQRQAFLQEIAMLQDLRSPYIVQFLGACLRPPHSMLVTEWMDESLWHAMARERQQSSQMRWYGRGREIALDVARGLHHLHSRGIMHFDLKSSNILLRQGVAKIADVGFAKVLSQSAHSSLVMGGTFVWAAPEVLLGIRSTIKADIYSFGVILWELVTGELPVRGEARSVIIPSECPADIKLLMEECIQSNPTSRPSAREIVHRLEAS